MFEFLSKPFAQYTPLDLVALAGFLMAIVVLISVALFFLRLAIGFHMLNRAKRWRKTIKAGDQARFLNLRGKFTDVTIVGVFGEKARYTYGVPGEHGSGGGMMEIEHLFPR